MTLWLKNYICCGYFWVATARHEAKGPLYIILKIYVDQNDWIPRTWANTALTVIGCWKLSIYYAHLKKKKWFSRKVIELKQCNLKHRNYLILSIKWFQTRCWDLSRLFAIILQNLKKNHNNHSQGIRPYGSKSTSAVVISGSPWLTMRL